MKVRNVAIALACAAVIATSAMAGASVPSDHEPAGNLPPPAQVRQRLAGLAVPFEANAGQFDPEVAFAARTFAGTLFVTRDGRLVHSFVGPPVEPADGRGAGPRHRAAATRGPGWTLTETLVGARPRPSGVAPGDTRVSRFVGSDPSKWVSDLPTWQRVNLGEAWPGITVELVARGNNVEKLFTLAPGADVRRIAVRLGGGRSPRIDGTGALLVRTGNGTVSFTPPVAWQDVDGERRPVEVAYVLAGDRYGFHLGVHDPAHAVVVDPLLQSTYLGGFSGAEVHAVAIDARGDMFVTGKTFLGGFPGSSGGAQPGFAGNGDAFVAKLDNGLNRYVQATYLGGTGSDFATTLALDRDGNVLVAGTTSSADFPGTAGGAQPSLCPNECGFVAKLDNTLRTLIRATYLGGSNGDYPEALALDGSGNVFVAGRTISRDFPRVAGGAQPVRGGGEYDGFVAKLDGGLTRLIQATYLGGSEGDLVWAAAHDRTGSIHVAGETASRDFPATSGGALPVKPADANSAFVAKLNDGLTAFVQATYLGGSHADYVAAIALDATGSVLVSGVTYSDDFPGTTGGAQPRFGGDRFQGWGDAFVAKLDSGLTRLIQATYLGGIGKDGQSSLHGSSGMALDADGNVFVTGTTDSVDFPHTANGVQPQKNGGYDAFVAKINNGLTVLIQASYLGGSGNGSTGASLAIDAAGNVFVAGDTVSPDFPGTAGGAQAWYAGGVGFVAKLSPSLRAIDPPSPGTAEVPLITPWLLGALAALVAGLGALHLAPRRR